MASNLSKHLHVLLITWFGQNKENTLHISKCSILLHLKPLVSAIEWVGFSCPGKTSNINHESFCKTMLTDNKTIHSVHYRIHKHALTPYKLNYQWLSRNWDYCAKSKSSRSPNMMWPHFKSTRLLVSLWKQSL